MGKNQYSKFFLNIYIKLSYYDKNYKRLNKYIYSGVWLERTKERIIERGYYRSPKGKIHYIPKGLRSNILKKLCHVNFLLMFNEDTPNLKNEPKKSIEYIMHICNVSKRTAYDYYTSLLHINYCPQEVYNAIRDRLEIIIKDLEKRGIDPAKALK